MLRGIFLISALCVSQQAIANSQDISEATKAFQDSVPSYFQKDGYVFRNFVFPREPGGCLITMSSMGAGNPASGLTSNTLFAEATIDLSSDTNWLMEPQVDTLLGNRATGLFIRSKPTAKNSAYFFQYLLQKGIGTRRGAKTQYSTNTNWETRAGFFLYAPSKAIEDKILGSFGNLNRACRKQQSLRG